MIEALRHVGLGSLIVAAALAACDALTDCKPAKVTEGQYTAALLACVDSAQSLAESKACRERVNRSWGIDAGDGVR